MIFEPKPLYTITYNIKVEAINMEIRYIEIKTCKDCPHNGLSVDSRRNKVVHFCIYKENKKIDQLPTEEINGNFYPIVENIDPSGEFTEYKKEQMKVHIPWWCRLSKPDIKGGEN
jgi:hypothetical protein